MTTKVEKSIKVNVPIHTAYNQWTQFEDFPQFMGGVDEVQQLDDETLHWKASIGGVKREWNARVLEQVPDEKVAWAATEGATNAGAVYFSAVGSDQTLVRLSLEYEPEGLVEKAGDALNIIGKQAESDLEKFKSFIESRGEATGAWRGAVNDDTTAGTPGVEAARSSQGDSGKSGGMSGKAAVAGVAAAAAGIAAASALKGRSGDSDSDEQSSDADNGAVAEVSYTTTEVVTEAPETTDTYTVVDHTDATYPVDPDSPAATDEPGRTI